MDAPLVSVNASGWAVNLSGAVGVAGRIVALDTLPDAATAAPAALADDRTVIGAVFNRNTLGHQIPVTGHC